MGSACQSQFISVLRSKDPIMADRHAVIRSAEEVWALPSETYETEKEIENLTEQKRRMGIDD